MAASGINATPAQQAPAALMEGVELDGGWKVGARLERDRLVSGGLFSFGYEAYHPTHGPAFLKALDYSKALASPDVPAALKRLIDAFVHERDLLERCSTAGLSKIVLPLAHGQITLPGHLIPVNYLIFERAEGDVRRQFAAFEAFDFAWVMRVLHDTATGIQQLHGEGMVHQDIKPSNLVTFSKNGATKIADLGRGEHRALLGPFATDAISGDWAYAPPEQLYGHQPADWGPRRRSCDLYHLGSMISFFFLGIATTPAIMSRLSDNLYPGQWGDSYAAVLPFLRDAFDDVTRSLEEVVPEAWGVRLVNAFRELCDPEPEKRGHPKSKMLKHGDRFSADRYVSLFDLLGKTAEYELRGNRQ
jgi:eukaryotic-like serine/threonine-protein kinase